MKENENFLLRLGPWKHVLKKENFHFQKSTKNNTLNSLRLFVKSTASVMKERIKRKTLRTKKIQCWLNRVLENEEKAQVLHIINGKNSYTKNVLRVKNHLRSWIWKQNKSNIEVCLRKNIWWIRLRCWISTLPIVFFMVAKPFKMLSMTNDWQLSRKSIQNYSIKEWNKNWESFLRQLPF